MKRRKKITGRLVTSLAAICFLGAGTLLLPPPLAASDNLPSFDADGEKIFKTYTTTPESYMAADSGDRNLMGFYELRQYPGSPPRVPHDVDLAFTGDELNCLSCHGLGGFSPEYNKFVPVTPHPENETCFQCHVPKRTDKMFVESEWQSIAPPKLGRSFLGGSPPPVPHSLQLRENCIACHTGPGTVVEIRVEHSSRGNCRQCHVPVLSTTPLKVFKR